MSANPSRSRTFPRRDIHALASQMQSLIDSPEGVIIARERIKPMRAFDKPVSDLAEIDHRALWGSA